MTEQKVRPLSSTEHEFLAYLEQAWLTVGMVPTETKAGSDGFDTAFYKKCIKNKDFRHAMLARGISLRGLDNDASPTGGPSVLDERQLVAANTMLDLRDNRSQAKKLRELGITTQRWEAWLRDPAFQHYLRTRAENLLGDNLHESHLALLDRVRSGDIHAIKYFNEITGRYVPNANDKADVQAVLLMVLEAIQRHVRDPEVLMALSEDLLSIGKNVNPTKVINAPAIERPYTPPLSVGSMEGKAF